MQLQSGSLLQNQASRLKGGSPLLPVYMFLLNSLIFQLKTFFKPILFRIPTTKNKTFKYIKSVQYRYLHEETVIFNDTF